jgi:predicted RNase H-like nuclease (RuvC/YqgF family)
MTQLSFSMRRGFTSLEDDVIELETEIKELLAKNSELEAKIDTLKGENEELEGRIDGLRERIRDHISTNASLRETIDELNDGLRKVGLIVK